MSSSGIYSQNSIKGVVYVANDTNQRLSNVPVYLIDSNQTVIGTVYTDSIGRYEFTSVAEGTYKLDMYKPWDFTGIVMEDVLAAVFVHNGQLSIDSLSKKAMDLNMDGQVDMVDAHQMLMLKIQQMNSVALNRWVLIQPFVTITETYIEETVDAVVNLESTPPAKRYFPPSGGMVKEDIGYYFIEQTETLPANNTLNYEISINNDADIFGFYISLNIPNNIQVLDVNSDQLEINYSLNNNKLHIYSTINGEKFYSTSLKSLINITLLINSDEISEVVLVPTERSILFSRENTSNSAFLLPKIQIDHSFNSPSINIYNDGKSLHLTNLNHQSTLQIMNLQGYIVFCQPEVHSDLSISTSQFRKGVYFIIIRNSFNEEIIEFKKIIIL